MDEQKYTTAVRDISADKQALCLRIVKQFNEVFDIHPNAWDEEEAIGVLDALIPDTRVEREQELAAFSEFMEDAKVERKPSPLTQLRAAMGMKKAGLKETVEAATDHVQDAKRYRWLREHTASELRPLVIEGQLVLSDSFKVLIARLNSESFDAAIDAAITEPT